jgi:mono/diheme cytochrome c family protein
MVIEVNSHLKSALTQRQRHGLDSMIALVRTQRSSADVREYTIAKTSPMPSYKSTLSGEEIADVLAYLLSLKGR